MSKLKTKVQKKMNDTDLHESLLKVQAALAEATGDVKGRASELVTELLENFQSKTNDYQNDFKEFISEKPLKSIGIAIAVGILVGKFVL